MKKVTQSADNAKSDNQFNLKAKYLLLGLKIIDYLIIAIKFYSLAGHLFIFESAINKIAQKQAFHYLLPFIVYSTIGVIRIAKYKKISLILLFIEMICNIYFIVNVGAEHAFYLILTTISLVIIIKLFYHITITRKDKMVI